MESTTLRVRDLETSSDAILVIRRTQGGLALGFAVEANGDLDLRVSAADARRLAEAIVAFLD
jgi:hypothetical protein